MKIWKTIICRNLNNDLFSTAFQSDDTMSVNAEDIIDEQMRQFYGIIPSQKASEIKTVRIVKREAERRRIHFSNGTSRSVDSFWLNSQFDSEFSTGGAVGGIGSIPPPYYYEDRDDDNDEGFGNSFGQSDDCNDGKHCMIDSLNAEFRNNNLFQKSNFVTNDKPLAQPQQEVIYTFIKSKNS